MGKGVPASIRAVLRPRNTVVIDSKSKGQHRYAVRCRNGYIKGKDGKLRPVCGKIIGHIINMTFVPVPDKPDKDELQDAAEVTVRRPRGRPKAQNLGEMEQTGPKRPRGSPRIHPKKEEPAVKRGRGRPRKHPLPEAAPAAVQEPARSTLPLESKPAEQD